MRGTVAKKIRRAARAASATNPTTNPTTYKTKWYEFFSGKYDDKGKKIMDFRGTVTCTGYRRVYQDMKHQYLNG